MYNWWSEVALHSVIAPKYLHETALKSAVRFAVAFRVRRLRGTIEKQTPGAFFIPPKISVCIFGNFQWLMEQQQVPLVPSSSVTGSSAPQFLLPRSSVFQFVRGLQLLGSHFLSFRRLVP